MRDGFDLVDHLSARYASIPCSQCQRSSISGRRPCAPSRSETTSQARSGLGRTLHHHQGALKWSIPHLQHSQEHGRAMRMERRAASSFLYLKIVDLTSCNKHTLVCFPKTRFLQYLNDWFPVITCVQIPQWVA